MILTAHQPVYLPWLGLFHKIALADKYVFFNEVQYLPKDWMNRNKIKTNSVSTMLTVPVLRKGHRDNITSNLLINNSEKWKKKHLRSIYINYKKTPFFDDYYSFFEDTYSRDWDYLDDLNEHMLKWFLQKLNIKTEFLKASDFDFVGTKSNLVLNMCKKLCADTYIFGSLGKDYANKEEFSDENIKLVFQDYNHPNYSQLHGEFVSNLSIIDLLFNCGKKSYDVLMSGNISKEELS